MLTDYGWGAERQQHFDAQNYDGLVPARVTMQQRDRYRLIFAHGELNAALSGKLAHEALRGGYPAVGDWVAVAARPDEGAATIHHVLPRATVFSRRAPGGDAQIVATNLDVALIASSLNEELNLRRLERYLAVARESGARPVVALTKADLCDDVDAHVAEVAAIAAGAPVHALSSLTGSGLEALRAALKPMETAALLGSSGVGKSTLLNALAGAEMMATRAISGLGARGRHTTTHRELFRLPSGVLILDSPGMRELGVWAADTGVSASFEDVEEIITGCRFSDCQHRREPGCAVRAALESGALEESRWRGYEKLQRELAFEGRKEDPLARAETRKVWIARTKAYRAQKKQREDDDG